MSTALQWTCEFCGIRQMLSGQNLHLHTQRIDIGETSKGLLGLTASARRCTNDRCNEMTLSVSIGPVSWSSQDSAFYLTETMTRVRIAPRSNAKPQPEYIPFAVRMDYEEACLIRDDSPKASATLARRALQGMIRDFCGIEGKTLYAEIKELERRVSANEAPKGVEEETLAAIHAVRQIGNIGAHMEGDINIIVDVDAGEAQALIDLIELLFDEWYVGRHTRQEKLSRLLEINGAKQTARSPAAIPPSPLVK